MSTAMPLPSGKRPRDPRFTAFEAPGLDLAQKASELFDAPLAAIRLEPGLLVSYHADTSASSKLAGTEDLWAALTSHLWYTRQAVATSDVTAAKPTGPAARAGLRSWLATPVLADNGAFLGAFCIGDTKPREWTPEDFASAREFAAAVTRELSPVPASGGTGRATKARLSDFDSFDSFASAAEALVRKASRRNGSHSADAVEVIEQLEAALEELQVTVEELNSMNEELQVARCLVEVEREHYRELFETVPYPYLTTDASGVIREANEAAVALFGCRRAFMVGKPLANFVAETARAGFRTRLRQLKTGGRSEWPLHVTPREQSAKLMMCAASATRSRESGVERVYWLFRELHEEDARETAVDEGGPIAVGRDPTTRSEEDFEELVTRATIDPELPVARQLHALIAGALDVGTLQIGQRLPSIRSIADRFGVTSYHALQAYAALEAEGVVERRERSGVYVAAVDWPQPPRLPETAEWVASVLTQACGHQLRVPQLPELIRRWTTSVAVRAVCVESCADTMIALSHELTNRFGVTTAPVGIGELVGPDGTPRRKSMLPAALNDAHFIVTTAFHASQVRALAEAAGKPLLVATTNPEIVDAITTHAEQRNLTVVCVDPEFGTRLREINGGAYRNRIQVALVEELDPSSYRSEPVFATHAARQKLGSVPLRLVAPPSPAFSLDFARKVAATLLRLNLNAAKS